MISNPFITLIALPLVATPIIYLVGRLGQRRTADGKITSPACWAGLLAMLATWIPFIQVYQSFQSNGPVSLVLGAVSLRVDGLSLLLSAVALLLATLVIIFSGPYLAHEDGEDKYYALLSAMTGAMIGLSCANDLFNLWVWFETMAIASYMLVAFYRQQAAALEAGVKYLVQSATGSILVLMGIAVVFGVTGTLNFDQIKAAITGSESKALLLGAGALFLIGFGVKAALVPLHTWLPDAHSQAPSGISAMLSGIVIEAGLVALLRALGSLSAVTPLWGALLLLFGALGMLVGNLMALRQTQVKRLLAFSSLSHMGYMLLGLGIAFAFNSAEAASGSFFHLLNHGMMKGLAFLSAGVLLYTLYAVKGSHQPLMISDLAGAARRYPLAAFSLSIAVLGLGGLPPLSGFMSKWQIFVAGFHTQNPWILALVIFAALNSVLSLGYYAPLVNAMYRQSPSQAVQQGAATPAAMSIPLLLLAVGIVVLGVWPALANGLTDPAGLALKAFFGG